MVRKKSVSSISTKINLLLLHNANGKCYNTLSVYPFSLSESSTLSATSIISIKIPPVFKSENKMNALKENLFADVSPACSSFPRVIACPVSRQYLDIWISFNFSVFIFCFGFDWLTFLNDDCVEPSTTFLSSSYLLALSLH